MLKSTYNHGFQMTFDNGITISVQFGAGNYCSSNTSSNKSIVADLEVSVVESTSAEIAIWDNNGKDYEFQEGRAYEGWVLPDDVAKWIAAASTAKSISEIVKP